MVTPLNAPPKPKNGRLKLNHSAIGSLNKKANTNTNISPIVSTTVLINPVLYPYIPNKIIILQMILWIKWRISNIICCF